MTAPTFYDVQVVGMHFRGAAAKEYAAALQMGDKLLLEREPENQYDANAIKVMTPGDNSWHLGYVAASSAAWISPHMDEGVVFDTTVSGLEEAKNNVYPIVTISPVEVADE